MKKENFENYVGDSKKTKKKNFKTCGFLAIFVLTLVSASMAVALPSFNESAAVSRAVLFGAEQREVPVEIKNNSTDPKSANRIEAGAANLVQTQDCVVRDDFNRADSTNMGANWTETDGDFSILGNRTVGTNSSAMSYTGAAPGDKACVEVYAANSGTQYGGVYLKWTSSGDNLFVKVQDNNGNGDFERIFFVRDGGFVFNQACAGGFVISSPFTSARLSVYLDGTTLKADIDTNFDNISDQSYSCAGAPARSGIRVALGIFGGTALDNFGIPPGSLAVTKTADTNDGACDADCSLREAIAAAASGDIIEFASPLFDSAQEIQLNGQLLINKNLTINGKGAKLLTLRQMSAGSRIIQIQNVTTVNLSGMTITGANIGFDNGAGILASYSNFPFPPGLTLNFSDLNITGNSCGGGGCGISTANYNLNLSNSTVSNNSSSYCCGGGGPGGIQFSGANTFNLINSTVSGNTSGNNNSTAGGGIWSIGSTLNVINSTITDNGTNGGSSGVNVGNGTVTVRNSIIAGNRNNTNTPDVTKTVSSTVISLGNNIIGNAPAGIGFTNGVNNDFVGNGASPFNPLLGTLADNGGSTPTHALLSNSQAINNGNNCVTDLSCSTNNPPFALTSDQRGKSRVGQVDIGAFEAPLNLVVTNTNDSGTGSLRAAITAANADPAFDNITFEIPPTNAGCVNGFCTITLTSGELLITANSSLAINGTGANRLAVSGNNQSRVFRITGGAITAISGLTITHGNSAASLPNNFGGGFFVSDGSALTLTNSAVIGNSAPGAGGGISNVNSTVSLANCTVSGNSAGFFNFGGGIYNSNGTVSLTNSTVSNNSATDSGFGGGIANGGTVRVRNTIISGNTATNNPNLFGSLAVNENNIIGDEANVRLAPLGFYGGQTQTHALLSGSTAINAGNNCVLTQSCATFNAPVALTTDQRGAARVGNVDIGAFELNNLANGGNFVADLPNGTQNQLYDFIIAPNNGAFTYTVSGGALPNGVNLTTNIAPNAVVALTGTPTQAGPFDFAITASDGTNTNVTNYRLQILAPTSANVSVSGRVAVGKSGLQNAIVMMTDTNGNTRSYRTGSFGYFVFENVEVGQTYVFQVQSKRFQFAPQVVTINEELTELNFVGFDSY